MTAVRIVVSLALITILGVILYFSPFRGNTLGVVGVYAFLSALIVFLVQTVEIEIIDEKKAKIAEICKFTSLPEEDHSNKTLSPIIGPLDLSYTYIYPPKNDASTMLSYSSDCQFTLSSLYKPSHATPVELPRQRKSSHRRVHARTKRTEKTRNESRFKPNPAKPLPA